jgi:8-oxo-dGTP diphosphatase
MKLIYEYKYPRPAVTADVIIFDKNKEKILLIERGGEPFKGMWALPGGFMDMNETIEQTAFRELEEETNLTGIELNQLHTFTAIGRDPRHRTVTTVFYGFIDDNPQTAIAGDDAAKAQWFNIYDLPNLAFDHREVIDFFIDGVL